jgi:hypothetical protein
MIYDFLYFCCFCGVLKGAKNGTGEERASFMFSTILFLLIMSFYFCLVSYINAILIDSKLLAVLTILLWVAVYYVNNFYFIKNKNYKKIIIRYQSTPSNTRKILGVVAVLMFFASFVIFGFSGVKMSNSIFHH